MDELTRLSDSIAVWTGKNDAALSGGNERLQPITEERMERLSRMVQVITDNLRERGALSSALLQAGDNVASEAAQMREAAARVDACLRQLREMVLEQIGTGQRLERLQADLPKLLDGALHVCQVHNIADLEMWLRGDETVGEVCEAVGCELIDPEEGDDYCPETMHIEQSEFTDDDYLAGKVCSCLMPGLQVRSDLRQNAHVLRQALVTIYAQA